MSPWAAERGRDQRRQEGRDHAVGERRPGADADEGEHVGAAVHERGPHAFEEGPARPEDDGGGQQHLRPGLDRGREEVGEGPTRQHVRHGQGEHGHGQGEADPEPTPHVGELGVLGLVERDRARARGPCRRSDSSPARSGRPRVHGAKVGAVGRRRVRNRLRGRREVPGRVRLEFFPAGHGAEVVGPAIVLDASRRGRGGDGHAADRIDLLRARVLTPGVERRHGSILAPASQAGKYPGAIRSPSFPRLSERGPPRARL